MTNEPVHHLYFEDVDVGRRLAQLVKSPTTVQLFRFSAVTWNAHRIHYDAAYAHSERYSGVLVQSHLHGSFLAQLVTAWGGPRSRLRRLRWENRLPAFAGDVLTCSGIVTGRRIDGPAHLLECELEERNQRGELCTPGWATIELPSRGAESR